MNHIISSEIYILDPLSSEDISAIETALEKKIPEPLRSLLVKVGFLQNAISGDWPLSAQEFIEMQKWIPDGYTAFINDGAGNCYVTSDQGGLHLWDHEINRICNTEYDFISFIDNSLRDPEPINSLSWRVQMAFDAKDDEKVMSALSKYFCIHVVGQWTFKDISPAGVSTYLLPVSEAGRQTAISKQVYAGWSRDIYYLNKVIPIAEIAKHKEIFQIMERDQAIGFKLINYGILPTDIG